MMHSVVIIMLLTDTASCRAVRTTLAGSIIPDFTMSLNSPVCASNPNVSSLLSCTRFSTPWSWNPAFPTIVSRGTCTACFIIYTPFFWSWFAVFSSSSPREAQMSALPPPATMPSAIAARVAQRASLMRSLTSPISTQEAPPTLMLATLPLSLLMRSRIFSLSQSEVLRLMCSLITQARLSMASFEPAPWMSTKSSLVTRMRLALPSTWAGSSFSRLSPISSLMYLPPVKTQRSAMMFLRLSPKEGAFTQHTRMMPWILLRMSVVRTSDSKSSAMMSSGLHCTRTSYSTLSRCLTLLTFFSSSRTNASSNSTFWVLRLVAKQGLTQPWSNFIPSIYSTSCFRVLPSVTVTEPFSPTLCRVSAIILPMSRSPLAEMVATCSSTSFSFTGTACAFSLSTMCATARSIPFFTCVVLQEYRRELRYFRLSWKMLRASTVAVVVPSPASSLVLLATFLMRLAPMLAALSGRSMALATVTPSLVILGLPKDCSMSTLRPLGPRVTLTASARMSAPSMSLARASLLKSSSLAKALWTAAARRDLPARDIIIQQRIPARIINQPELSRTMPATTEFITQRT